MASIELIYLQHPVHPNITVIQVGPGISRIEEGSHSYWIHGSPDGPLAGKWVEIPKSNIAAVQWCELHDGVGRVGAELEESEEAERQSEHTVPPHIEAQAQSPVPGSKPSPAVTQEGSTNGALR